jgi:predicted nucleic acid-binding Zn ribbon protein
MFPIAELYPVLTEHYADIPEVQQGIVRIAWNHCVGENLRKVSEPAYFQDGVLTVSVNQSQWQQTLISMKTEIIAKINRYLRRPLVSELKIQLRTV